MSNVTFSPSLAAINGPFIIGYTLCFILMGALSVQTYIYFARFPDDRRAIKTLVTTIFILEILMTTITFCGFWFSATNPADYGVIVPGDTRRGYAPFLSLAPITGLVTTLTHGFYCWRIANIRRSFWIPIPVMILSLLQLASIIYLAFTDGLSPSNLTINYTSSAHGVSYSVSPWLATWLGSSVICDLTITICMIITLRPSNSQFQTNKSTLAKLTRLTIETGLVTTIAALLELILGTVFMRSMYHMAMFYILSKLYANGLLASLNFRLVVRTHSNSNATAIVWDDATQSRYRMSSLQFNQVGHIVAQVRTDVDITVESDENKSQQSGLVSDQSSTM